MNIAVYCASVEGLGENIASTARELGQWIGRNGHTLVYGGANAGLMHVVAQAAHDSGAHVVGVLPEFFRHRLDPVVDEVIFTRDLNDRKAEMYSRGEVFVVLPGGLGTIDEWIATVSHISVDKSPRRVVVMNLNGMYDNMVEQMRVTTQSPFSRGIDFAALSLVASNIPHMIEILNEIASRQQ